MKIRDAEKTTGIGSANIRYYEHEGLISPDRNRENSYREYSEEDIDTLRRIKLLRILGVSIGDIRKLMDAKLSLEDVMRGRVNDIKAETERLDQIAVICNDIAKSRSDFRTMKTEPSEYDSPVVKKRFAEVLSTDTISETIDRKQLNRGVFGRLIYMGVAGVLITVLFGQRISTYGNAFAASDPTQGIIYLLGIFFFILVLSYITVMWTSKRIPMEISFQMPCVAMPVFVLLVSGACLPSNETASAAADVTVMYVALTVFIAAVYVVYKVLGRFGFIWVMTVSAAAGICFWLTGISLDYDLNFAIVTSLLPAYFALSWWNMNRNSGTFSRYYEIREASVICNVITNISALFGYYGAGNWRRGDTEWHDRSE